MNANDRTSRRLNSNTKLIALAAFGNSIIICLHIVLFYRSWRNFDEQAKAWSQNVAKLLEVSVYDKFDAVERSLSNVVHEVENQLQSHTIDQNKINANLRFQISQTKNINNFLVANESGDIIYGNEFNRDKIINVNDRDYFARLCNHPEEVNAVSNLLKGRILDKWEVVLARKIHKPDGAFGGAVIATFNIDYFNTLFSNYKLGPNGAIGIRDLDYRLVALYPKADGPASQIGSDVVSQTTRDMIKSNPTTATYSTIFARDHKRRMVTFRKISDYPFYVFATISPDEYLYAWKKELAFTSVLLAIFVGATIVSIYVTIKNRNVEIAHAASIQYGEKLNAQNRELNEALSRVRRLEGLISICAYCKKIRNEQESWEQLENYISEHSDAKFSHGICPNCMNKYFPEYSKDAKPKQ